MSIEDEPTIKDYYDLRTQLNNYAKDMRDVVNHPQHCLQFLQSGRLVRIKHNDHDFGWGAVVNFAKCRPPKGQPVQDPPNASSYVVDVLLQVASDVTIPANKNNDELPPGVRPPMAGEKGKMEVVPVLLSTVDAIGHLRIFLPTDLRSPDQRNNVRKGLEEVKRRFPDGIAILDPVENMGIQTKVSRSCSAKSRFSSQDCSQILCTTHPDLQLSTPSTSTRSSLATKSRMSESRSAMPCLCCKWRSSSTDEEFFAA